MPLREAIQCLELIIPKLQLNSGRVVNIEESYRRLRSAGQPRLDVWYYVHMAVIPEPVRQQLKDRFESVLTGPVHLTLYTRPGSSRLILPAGLGCPTCDDARQMVELLRDAKGKYTTISFDDKGSETIVFDHKEALAATEDVLNDNGIRQRASDDLAAVWEGKGSGPKSDKDKDKDGDGAKSGGGR